MAKEILFVCDPCQANGERNSATHIAVEFTLGKAKPKMLDLCDQDYDVLVLPLEQALEKFGYVDDAPAPKRQRRSRLEVDPSEGPLQCGLCETQPAHRKAFSNHCRQVHDMTLTAYIAANGEPQLVEQ